MDAESFFVYIQFEEEFVNDALSGLFTTENGVQTFLNWLENDSGYSKEARQFEKVKRAFEKAYKETTATKNTAEGGDIRYSLMNDDSFEDNVRDVVNMTDDVALKKKEQGNFIRVMNNTPSVILDNVKDAGNYEVIIRFDALYLASRKDGVLEGHYHNLGEDIIKKLPEFIENPDAIVRMNNGRLNLFTTIKTPKGNNGIISMEMNTVKDINSKYNKYNLVVSVFSAKDNYTRNNLYKNGENVEYQKEDLSQVNPQLYEWLTIINDKSSVDSISNSTENVKQKQLEIIEKVNPAPNTYNTWIRKVEDIKTLAETLEDSDWADGDEFNPDLTRGMIEEAIESGEITVYSSYPIGQGVFVSPSYMEAASYSGDGNVYEKTVSIKDVAWIDPTQGMYAKIAENQKVQFSLSDNLEKTERTLYNKNSPLAIVDRAKTNNNSSLNWVYKSEIFSVNENRLFHEKISEINQGSQAFSKNSIGEYMIPVENKIIFTDGNYDSPYVREIVEVLTEYQTEFDDIRERIYNVEKGKSEKQDAARYVYLTYGKGRIITYTSGVSGVYGWEDGRRKGKTRRAVIRNHLNKQHRGRNDRTSKETQINETEPIKETSSEDGVFSLSSDSTTSKKYGNFYGEDVMLQKNNIAPTRESIAEKEQAAKDNKFPMLDEDGIAPIREDVEPGEQSDTMMEDIGPVAENSNNESNSIKEQLRSSQDKLNSMETVGKLNDSKVFDSRQDVVGWVLDKIKDAGYKIKRSNFGEIIFDRKRIQNVLRYLKTNDEKLAFALVPTVLEKGTQIGHHTEHKGRNYDTTTFAAPVEINGVQGNMAVVVRSAGENYYKVHRLVLPDGSQFSFNKKGDIAERVGGAESSSGLSPTDNISVNSISNIDEKVNAENKPTKRSELHINLVETQKVVCGDTFPLKLEALPTPYFFPFPYCATWIFVIQ